MPKATTPKAAKRPTFSWDTVSQAEQIMVLDVFGDDGHSILDADAMRANGDVPTSVINEFEQVEKSDGSYKGSIFSSETGERVTEMRGIYCLSVIRSLARHHAVSSSKFGRGSEARELTAKIRAILEQAS